MPFLGKFVEWIANVGEKEIARSLGCSRQSVRCWRRYAAGAPAGRNVYPPSIVKAREIEVLSGLTLNDLYQPR